MTRQTLAAALAARVSDAPTAQLLESIAADDELMEIAAADMDAAVRILVDVAIDTVCAYVAEHRDTTGKRAA